MLKNEIKEYDIYAGAPILFLIVATFENTVGDHLFKGVDEEESMYYMIEASSKYGKITWYSGYSNEDYVDGEYIGRENFIF